MPGKLWYDGELVGRAREMRRRGRGAEVWLWLALRRVRPRFQRQKVLGGTVVDFYCTAARVAVEVDGGVHQRERADGSEAERTVRLRRLGVEVLRFDHREVWRNVEGVVGRIRAAVRGREASGACFRGGFG